MHLSKSAKLAIRGRAIQAVGFALYLAGAVISIGVAIGGHKVSRIKSFSDTMIALLVVIMLGLLALIVLRFGQTLFLRGKRVIAKGKELNAKALVADEGLLPVLYLRSFNDDEITSATPAAEFRGVSLPMLSTEEEHLAGTISDIGPFLAIAKPSKERGGGGESLPYLGAIRISADEQSWQDTVLRLMRRAQLVIFRVGDGHWLWWEIERAIEIVKPERRLFLIPNDASVFRVFRERIQPLIPHEIPDLAGVEQVPTSIGAILYFNPDGSPRVSALENAGFRASISQPLRPMLRIALKPVFDQLHLPWTPPPVPLWIVWPVIFLGAVMLVVLRLFFTSFPWDYSSNRDWLSSLPFLFFIVVLGVVSLMLLFRGALLYSAIVQFKPSGKIHAFAETPASIRVSNGEKIESFCHWTRREVAGIALDFKEYLKRKEYSRKHIIGYMCSACGAVSHKESVNSGIKFSWWSGYEKSKCAACGEHTSTPHVIVPEKLR